jgi:hypothetical protein
MKPLTLLTVLFILLGMATTITCKQDKETGLEHYPTARAGTDINVTLASCKDRNGFADLDGSASSDPDGNVAHAWKKLYGPTGGELTNPDLAKTRALNLTAGIYTYELAVHDATRKYAYDTVRVFVKGAPDAFDLDLTFTSSFKFTPKSIDCFEDDWGSFPCPQDITVISGKAPFAPLGEFTITVQEYADTAALSDIVYQNGFAMLIDNSFSNSLSGTHTINFKRLVERGGGAFTGDFLVTDASAKKCAGDILTSLAPLSLRGHLDLAARTITMRIKGKVYF